MEPVDKEIYALWGLLKQLAPVTTSYLEIGVSEGGSLRRVVQNAPKLDRLVLCDMWGCAYGGMGRGSNQHIKNLLRTLGYVGAVTYLDGDSKITVPTIRETFDLATVDGDHSDQGALIDLKNTWPLIVPGGWLVFDDIIHPSHMSLRGVFERFAAGCPDAQDITLLTDSPHGVAFMRKNNA
jgi:predicted O-methyltransferase YrrM